MIYYLLLMRNERSVEGTAEGYRVWFQNRRSKERRMKQLRYGGYRPTRRNRGGSRDDLCAPPGEIFAHDANSEPYYGQPPLSFYCEGYPPPEGAPPAALPHPSFIIPPDAHHMHIEPPANEATYMEDSLRPPHSSPNMPLAAQDDAYRPMQVMYPPPEIKSVVPGW
uniref:Homeobox domain-containing protein n=2 Tax=Ascaris TaxID=6251 RepID=A0A0M3HQW5_ASCLU